MPVSKRKDMNLLGSMKKNKTLSDTTVKKSPELMKQVDDDKTDSTYLGRSRSAGFALKPGKDMVNEDGTVRGRSFEHLMVPEKTYYVPKGSKMATEYYKGNKRNISIDDLQKEHSNYLGNLGKSSADYVKKRESYDQSQGIKNK